MNTTIWMASGTTHPKGLMLNSRYSFSISSWRRFGSLYFFWISCIRGWAACCPPGGAGGRGERPRAGSRLPHFHQATGPRRGVYAIQLAALGHDQYLLLQQDGGGEDGSLQELWAPLPFPCRRVQAVDVPLPVHHDQY